MKRRSFLKGVAGAVAAAVVPKIAGAEDPVKASDEIYRFGDSTVEMSGAIFEGDIVTLADNGKVVPAKEGDSPIGVYIGNGRVGFTGTYRLDD